MAHRDRNFAQVAEALGLDPDCVTSMRFDFVAGVPPRVIIEMIVLQEQYLSGFDLVVREYRLEPQ